MNALAQASRSASPSSDDSPSGIHLMKRAPTPSPSLNVSPPRVLRHTGTGVSPAACNDTIDGTSTGPSGTAAISIYSVSLNDEGPGMRVHAGPLE